MDEQSRNLFYELLRHNAHDHGKSILMITHDHEDIKEYADRQIPVGSKGGFTMALLSYEFMRRAFWLQFYCRNRTDARCVSCDPKTVFDGRYTLTCFISWCSIRLFLNLNPDLTTLLIVIIAAVILEYLRTLYRSYSEISIAILMSGRFGISIGPL